ncbi:hypothetical protein EXIGLDRAFT_689583 [Exidia glandulosa HHB12029]|uniref:PB1 domain-containing protein n=1 Tax=Exidia glandulosa HHB12029 TaxID=1314781 RepID=A0A166N5R1_EXIGL|nr:hypothetical protein EXIGLDRAFT_689583 [Exidia glandulosa HHB12029]
MHYASSMRTPSTTSSTRPDRPLVVKCKCNDLLRKITFSSARSVSMQLLQTRLEQCFMLSESAYTIQYTDDDGEVATLASEGDLTEAICYFQPSQRTSIGSIDSWQQRKLTMYIDIVLEDDRFSISDLGSESGGAVSRRTSLSQASHRSSMASNTRPGSLAPLGGWGHIAPLAAIAERGSNSNITPVSDEPPEDAQYSEDRERILQRAEALETFARIIRQHVEIDDRDWVRAMAYTHIGTDALDFVAATRSVSEGSQDGR